MTVAAALTLALVVTFVGADTCDGPGCSTNDANVLLQAKVAVQNLETVKIIESVDDIDMEALGLQSELLDKENTLILEGVPIFNYGSTYEGGMNPSLIELAETKDWIVQFSSSTTDSDLDGFCEGVANDDGNGQCLSKGHPTEGGMPMVVFRGTHDELQTALQNLSLKPEYVEHDGIVNAIPEEDAHEDSSEETAGLLELGGPASWGLDRIDDALGLNNQDYRLPAGSKEGQGTHVYVADTGVRITHTDFEGRAVAAIELLSGAVKVCTASEPNCAEDVNGHGTHCAGTIGGKMYGVAKKTSLYGVKMLSNSGKGSWSDLIRSLDWVASSGNKPAVWSASLGGRGTMQSISTAIDRALEAGVLASVAGGNNNIDACGFSPAFAPNAITVGASQSPARGTPFDSRASFSNYGSCIDIFAPGVGIKSASSTSDTGSATMSGTSMACPHVSGALAVFLSDGQTVAGVTAYMKNVGSPNTIMVWDVPGSPSLMLHVGTPLPDQTPSTQAPTMAPSTQAPTQAPTMAPTQPPSTQPPTLAPTLAPSTQAPTLAPSTQAPTQAPTQPPSTQAPTMAPTEVPTEAPTEAPPTKQECRKAFRQCKKASPLPKDPEAIKERKKECKESKNRCNDPRKAQRVQEDISQALPRAAARAAWAIRSTAPRRT